MRPLTSACPVLGRMLAATFAMLAIGAIAASAQAPLSLDPFAPQNRPAPPASLDNLKQRDKELEALRAEQRKTLENEAKLKREIELMGDDRRKLNQQILETTARVAAVEDRIAKTQARIEPLDEREEALRASLQQRRNLISELLAALQRIGREAPPALLVRAEDALQSVRSAMVLGAVLPEVRQQAEFFPPILPSSCVCARRSRRSGTSSRATSSCSPMNASVSPR